MRKMIDEIFKTFGIDKKCDDVFVLTVLLDGIDYYLDYFGELEDAPDGFEELDDKEVEEKIKDIVQMVSEGKMPKPDWMKEIEKRENSEGYRPSTILSIHPKDPKHTKLAQLIHDFLYSTEQESSYG